MQAIVRMKESPHEQDKLNFVSIHGILCFGVPNHGMEIEAMVNMIQNRPARFTLNLLDKQQGFRLRNRSHAEFCDAFDFEASKVISFFERRSSHTLAWVIQLCLVSLHVLTNVAG